MKNYLNFIFLTILCTACSWDSETNQKELEPTLANLVGVWISVEYQIGGENVVSSKYNNNYMLIDADRLYSARLTLEDLYRYGTISVFNETFTLRDNDGELSLTPRSLTADFLELTGNVGGVTHMQKFRRMKEGTTYQVMNNSSLDSLDLYSFYIGAFNTFIYTNRHGLSEQKELKEHRSYTKHPDNMHIGCSYVVGNRILVFISAYPQKMDANAHNVISMQDTTMVYRYIFDIEDHNAKTHFNPFIIKPFKEYVADNE